jgi:hypothetical protein
MPAQISDPSQPGFGARHASHVLGNRQNLANIRAARNELLGAKLKSDPNPLIRSDWRTLSGLYHRTCALLKFKQKVKGSLGQCT